MLSPEHHSASSLLNQAQQQLLNSGPRSGLQFRGPKTYPCKYFHGVKGCHYGDACTFIHEPKYKGLRIPQSEMYAIINDHHGTFSKLISSTTNLQPPTPQPQLHTGDPYM